jgi:hypothetical protein
MSQINGKIIVAAVIIIVIIIAVYVATQTCFIDATFGKEPELVYSKLMVNSAYRNGVKATSSCAAKRVLKLIEGGSNTMLTKVYKTIAEGRAAASPAQANLILTKTNDLIVIVGSVYDANGLRIKWRRSGPYDAQKESDGIMTLAIEDDYVYQVEN